MTEWPFWGERKFSGVYENIYIRSFVEDWFKIVGVLAGEINSRKTPEKLILDLGCGEGHTTKQILDRLEGKYVCDLLEPDVNALVSAKAHLATENSIGECYPCSLSNLETDKKYDFIFTSHTNYYWAASEQDYQAQLSKLLGLLKAGGKLLILTLPKDSSHYKIMLRQVYPEFNYAEYVADHYRHLGARVEVQKLKMRLFVGDMLTTRSRFDLRVFYGFIHNTEAPPNNIETENFLKKIKEFQRGGYIDFKDHLVVVSK